ncbi:MAG TPA: energy transducer TonB [Candidatus Angelobacter sp.]|nr:energy transducer TonB [Candidatus Angelobacter sp.]
MRFSTITFFLALLLVTLSFKARSEDAAARVRSAVKRSTLDQPGTKPFHLKAALAPSRERDRDSGRTGEIEIWWESPTRFRREVRSPEFHQIEIVDGDHRWQKNEGDYFPDWLRQTAIALIQPIPSLDETIKMVEEADTKRLMGSTYYEWSIMSSDGNVQKGMGATVALTDSTDLLFYCGGFGWGAIYHDYKKFHDRMVGRTVGVGSPEVTARIVTLEDLKDAPATLFDAQTAGADANPIETVMIDELVLRKNLAQPPQITWPAVQNGRQEGVLTTEIAVDREGKIREIGTIVSDNPAVDDAARKIISTMRFTPYLLNGRPVQVLSRITMPFKAARLEGSAK